VKGLDQKLSQTASDASGERSVGAAAPIRVALFGARGRMGTKLVEALAEDRACSLVASIDRDDPLPAAADVVIDFSSPEGSKRALEAAKAVSAALLVGTTGLDDGFRRALEDAAKRMPILVASNTSLGVAVMHRMVAMAVRGLGSGWRVQLEEIHHARKVDAPSGTALALASTVEGAGGALSRDRIVSIRQGEVVGTHRIEFTSPVERLVLVHEALDRALFARGAVVLARWLHRQPPGMHSVQAWLQERLDEGTRS
jgi:4-hydroxy-tetrahydrodipicolinate reductase